MIKKLKSKLPIFLILLSAISYMLFANMASAQVIGNWDFLKGIVPCGTSYASHACTVCDFFVLIQNIINFLLFAFASLATLAAIYIAFLFMFSGGSPAKITDAKGKLWLVIIGIFWVLGSWLVLNTILNFIVDQSVFPWPWNQIKCEVSRPTISSPASGGGGSPFGGGASGGGGAIRTFPEGTLSEQGARNQFQQAGITINKNPCPAGVSYQSVSGGCTSLEGVRASTIEGAKKLKEDCNCTVIVTGGTEKGHSTVGTKTHGDGYKLDFARSDALDSYITNNYTYIGIRSGDGAKLYKSSSGAIFAKESDHWDTKGWDAEF